MAQQLSTFRDSAAGPDWSDAVRLQLLPPSSSANCNDMECQLYRSIGLGVSLLSCLSVERRSQLDPLRGPGEEAAAILRQSRY